MDIKATHEESIKNGKGNELFPVFFRMDKLHLVVIGGGAAGFFTAIRAKENNPSLEVVLLEKQNKLKSKIA